MRKWLGETLREIGLFLYLVGGALCDPRQPAFAMFKRDLERITERGTVR